MRIAVVTGTRADYGLLRWLIVELRERGAEVVLVATGSHLSPEFGSTWRDIVADGIEVDERVDMLLSSDRPVAIPKSIGIGTMGIAEVLDRRRPELVVILGDRFEALAAAQAALLLGIPIAHLAGGELTEGAYDDAIRHAITKMSQLHFVASDEYAARVRQLGEDPAAVFTVGAMGLDNLERLPLLDRAALEADLGMSLQAPLAVVTMHMETLSGSTPEQTAAPLLRALDDRPELRVVLTKGNADTGGRELNALLDAWAATRSERVGIFTSLGQLRYLSLIAIADVVVGNSSSGIVEAPAAGVPTVDIGDRQRGRQHAPSVISADDTATSIGAAIGEALSPRMRAIAARRESPFGRPGAAVAVADVLTRIDPGSLGPKTFHDLGGIHDR